MEETCSRELHYDEALAVLKEIVSTLVKRHVEDLRDKVIAFSELNLLPHSLQAATTAIEECEHYILTRYKSAIRGVLRGPHWKDTIVDKFIDEASQIYYDGIILAEPQFSTTQAGRKLKKQYSELEKSYSVLLKHYHDLNEMHGILKNDYKMLKEKLDVLREGPTIVGKVDEIFEAGECSVRFSFCGTEYEYICDAASKKTICNAFISDTYVAVTFFADCKAISQLAATHLPPWAYSIYHQPLTTTEERAAIDELVDCWKNDFTAGYRHSNAYVVIKNGELIKHYFTTIKEACQILEPHEKKIILQIEEYPIPIASIFSLNVVGGGHNRSELYVNLSLKIGDFAVDGNYKYLIDTGASHTSFPGYIVNPGTSKQKIVLGGKELNLDLGHLKPIVVATAGGYLTCFEMKYDFTLLLSGNDGSNMEIHCHSLLIDTDSSKRQTFILGRDILFKYMDGSWKSNRFTVSMNLCVSEDSSARSLLSSSGSVSTAISKFVKQLFDSSSSRGRNSQPAPLSQEVSSTNSNVSRTPMHESSEPVRELLAPATQNSSDATRGSLPLSEVIDPSTDMDVNSVSGSDAATVVDFGQSRSLLATAVNLEDYGESILSSFKASIIEVLKQQNFEENLINEVIHAALQRYNSETISAMKGVSDLDFVEELNKSEVSAPTCLLAEGEIVQPESRYALPSKSLRQEIMSTEYLQLKKPAEKLREINAPKVTLDTLQTENEGLQKRVDVAIEEHAPGPTIVGHVANVTEIDDNSVSFTLCGKEYFFHCDAASKETIKSYDKKDYLAVTLLADCSTVWQVAVTPLPPWAYSSYHLPSATDEDRAAIMLLVGCWKDDCAKGNHHWNTYVVINNGALINCYYSSIKAACELLKPTDQNIILKIEKHIPSAAASVHSLNLVGADYRDIYAIKAKSTLIIKGNAIGDKYDYLIDTGASHMYFPGYIVDPGEDTQEIYFMDGVKVQDKLSKATRCHVETGNGVKVSYEIKFNFSIVLQNDQGNMLVDSIDCLMIDLKPKDRQSIFSYFSNLDSTKKKPEFVLGRNVLFKLMDGNWYFDGVARMDLSMGSNLSSSSSSAEESRTWSEIAELGEQFRTECTAVAKFSEETIVNLVGGISAIVKTPTNVPIAGNVICKVKAGLGIGQNNSNTTENNNDGNAAVSAPAPLSQSKQNGNNRILVEASQRVYVGQNEMSGVDDQCHEDSKMCDNSDSHVSAACCLNEDRSDAAARGGSGSARMPAQPNFEYIEKMCEEFNQGKRKN